MADRKTASFQLIIKDNLDAARDAFGTADVRRLPGAPVRVGSRTDCECVVDSEDLAPVHYTLDASDDTGRWRVTPHPQRGSPVFLNGEAICEPSVVRSGDELRVGHWTFRLQRVADRVSRARRTGLIEAAAKVLLCLTLAAETLLVAWLPHQLQSVRLWELRVAQHEATFELDRLRRTLQREPETGVSLDDTARRLLADELDSLARFLRQEQDRLTRGQWRRVQADLLEYERVLERLRDGAAFRPVPEVDIEAGVRSIVDGRPGKME